MLLEILTIISIVSGIISTILVILRSSGLFKGISSLKPEQIDKCCSEFLKINSYSEKEELVNRIKEQAYCTQLFGIFSNPNKIKILAICQKNKVSPYISRAIRSFMTIENNELKTKNIIDIAGYVYLAFSYFIIGMFLLAITFISILDSNQVAGTIITLISMSILAISGVYIFEFFIFLCSRKKIKETKQMIDIRLQEIVNSNLS